jgi:outer membrane lipoprotein-sorting protein
LTPKPETHAAGDADFTLTLKASTKDFFPGEAALRVGRASIRSTFEHVRLNPELPDDAFRFSPPSGADVFATPEQP